jgi:hypothetical protein
LFFFFFFFFSLTLLFQEIAIQDLKDLVNKVPFLRREKNDGRDDVFVARVATALQPEYYIAGDDIFKQGDVS